jgi:hypothetical protein
VDVAALQAEVTRTCEAVATAKAARATVVLTAEASAWEATAAWDGATLCIKDARDRATLLEREVLERLSRVEAENSAALASARDDAEGLVQKIALLESELAEERKARKTSEREDWECFDELTLLQAQGLELCLSRRLFEGMWLATLHHNEMVRELAVFQAVVSSATELVLKRSPNNVAHAEVLGELVAELHRVERHRSWHHNFFVKLEVH